MKLIKKARVVIVEDELLIADLISGFVDAMGFHVVGEFRRGEEVVREIDELKPDVVIMDIRLPDIDGIEATKQIFEKNPVPVVMLSAFDDKELVEKATAVGVGAYLVKPTDARELERAIIVSIARFDDMIQHRRLSEQLKQEINERQETELKLKEVNQFLNFIIDHASTWFVVFNADKEVVIWNMAAESITGYTKSEIRHNPKLLDKIFIGYQIQDILFPHIDPSKSDVRENKEIYIQNKTNETCVLSFASKCVKDENGIVGFVSIAIDVTNMKKTEKAYLESEERLHLLIESTEDIVTLHNVNGTYLYYNGPSSFPMKDDEVIGKTPKDVFGNEIGRRILEQIQQVALSGQHLTLDNHLVWKNKSYWFSDHIFPVRNKKDRIFQIAIFSRNITERKRVEEALRESEAQYRILFETAREAIIAFNIKGKIIRANPAAAKMLGFPSPEMMDHIPILSIFKETKTHQHVIHNLNEYGFIERFEATLKTRNESKDTIQVLGSITQQKDSQDRVTYFEAIFYDITERTLAENTLRKSRELLRNYSAHLQNALEKERAHIAREIHDELGQSLTALKMDLSWLKNRLQDDEDPIQQKMSIMFHLIDQTIQIVKHLSSELRPGLLDDLGLTAAIEWQSEEFIKRTGIDCELHIEPEEMDVSEELSIVVFRIFQEAMTNVMRHAEANHVKTKLKKDNDYLMLYIQDDGIGITDEQLENPNAFGLIGMKERVQFFGGKITIRGTPAHGTTIDLKLPLERA